MSKDKHGITYLNKKGLTNAEYSRQRREQARNDGTCASHPPRKAVRGTLACQECAEKAEQRITKAKLLGNCLSHRNRKAVNGNNYCSDCLLNKKVRNLLSAGVSEAECIKARKEWSNFNGRCQSCNSEFPGTKGWAFDHNHATNTFRGIICTPCNLILGHSNDSTWQLESLILYLRRIK